MAKDTPITIRAEAELRDRLRRAAAADDRSISSLCDRILRAWLLANGYPPADATDKPPRTKRLAR